MRYPRNNDDLTHCASCKVTFHYSKKLEPGLIFGEPYYDMDARPICLHCWTRQQQNIDYRRVAITELGIKGDHLAVKISTVLLGLDHNFAMTGPPLIFETMVFTQDGDIGYMERYPTKESALSGHDRAVQWAKDELFLSRSDEKQIYRMIEKDK